MGMILTRIQTDDVGFFCSPVSNEYLLAAQHFGLDREDLVRIAKRSVESIFGGEKEKERLRNLLVNLPIHDIDMGTSLS